MGFFTKSYTELESELEARLDRFIKRHGFFAENQAEVEKNLRKLKLTPDQVEQVEDGSYVRMDALNEYGDLTKALANVLEEAMQDDDFLMDVFYTLLNRCDFRVTRDPTPVMYLLEMEEGDLRYEGRHGITFAEAVGKCIGYKDFDPYFLSKYAWEPDYGIKDAIRDILTDDVTMAVELAMRYWSLTDTIDDDVFPWPHFEGLISNMSPIETFELGNVSRKWPKIPSDWIKPDGDGYYPITYGEIVDATMDLIETDEFLDAILLGKLEVHHSIADAITLFMPGRKNKVVVSGNVKPKRFRKKKTKNIFKNKLSRGDKVRSKNWKSDFNRCKDTIMRIHRAVILESREEREKGLENAMINVAALDGFCNHVDWEQDCFGKAALAIDYIVAFHPFAEGNKRTAFNVDIAILGKENFTVRDRESTYQFIRDVATYGIKKEMIEDWLKENCILTIPKPAHDIGEFSDVL